MNLPEHIIESLRHERWALQRAVRHHHSDANQLVEEIAQLEDSLAFHRQHAEELGGCLAELEAWAEDQGLDLEPQPGTRLAEVIQRDQEDEFTRRVFGLNPN